MTTPKYSIGQTVFFYMDGKLERRTIKEVHIVEESVGTRIGYLMNAPSITDRLCWYRPEVDVFISPADFVNRLGLNYSVQKKGKFLPNAMKSNKRKENRK